ncbi:MAG: hypothetical protein ACKN9X_00935 [Candidatus Methylopumilus sp.]
MKNKIKAICLSKTNILSVSFSIFLFLKDIKEVITGFASHIILIGLSIIVLIGLLIIHLFLTKSKKNNIENNSSVNAEIINPKENISQSNESVKSSTTVVSKIIFATILFFTLMTIGSLYYVKNMGVYYVVLENNLTIKEAKELMERTNNSSVFSSNGLSSRILELPNDKYELILRNGYINEAKADSDLEKVKSLQSQFKPYMVGPQKVANYFRKLWYLQNHIFN